MKSSFTSSEQEKSNHDITAASNNKNLFIFGYVAWRLSWERLAAGLRNLPHKRAQSYEEIPSDEHEKAINEIKRTYVNKDELKEFKSDINKSLEKLQQDVDNIKENSLTKREFLQIQNKTEGKIDKIYELLMKKEGI